MRKDWLIITPFFDTHTHTHTHTHIYTHHTHRWEALKDLAAKRRSILVAALDKAKHFHDNWKQQVDWLDDAEKKAYAEWKPCALPETCEAEITKHQVYR